MSYYKIQDFKKCMINPSKYTGQGKCTLRSGWEIKFATWLDKHPSVTHWSVEEVVIPYYIQYNNGKKKHRYFMDFWMRMDTVSGIKEFLIEIKPQKQKDEAFLLREGKTIPLPKKQTKKAMGRYYRSISVANRNNEKWKATDKLCVALQEKGRDINFLILTERDLPV